MIQRTRLLILILLVGCSSTKQVTQPENAPDWVKSKPSSDIFYYGIGIANKNGNTDHINIAKEKALADLSSEIKTVVSTQSVLFKFESSFGYSEDFTATTTLVSQEDLEGFELVSTYDFGTYYYVWYRLSKALYAEIKEKRKTDAANKSLDYYIKVKEAKSQNLYFNAITNCIKGLEIVKPYLTESLEIQYQNETIYLGNELFSELLAIVNDIKITANKSEIRLKRGEVSMDELRFTCRNANNHILPGLPIIFTLKQRPLANNHVESDIKGEVGYSLNQINGLSENELFTASVDLSGIASQITTDPSYRKLLRKIDAPKSQVRIQVSNPTFYVSTIEKNLNVDLETKIIEKKVKQTLSEIGYPVVDQKEMADYVFESISNTITSKQDSKFYYVDMQGEMKIYNKNSQMVFHKPIENIKGVQLSYRDAGIDAYKNLSENITRNLANRIKEVVK